MKKKQLELGSFKKTTTRDFSPKRKAKKKVDKRAEYCSYVVKQVSEQCICWGAIWLINNQGNQYCSVCKKERKEQNEQKQR